MFYFLSVWEITNNILLYIHTVAKQLIIVLKSEPGMVGLEISVCHVEGTVVVSWSSSVDSLLDLTAVFLILSLPDNESYIWYGSKVVGLLLFCNLVLKHFYVFRSTSLVWCQDVLIVSTWLWYFALFLYI